MWIWHLFASPSWDLGTVCHSSQSTLTHTMTSLYLSIWSCSQPALWTSGSGKHRPAGKRATSRYHSNVRIVSQPHRKLLAPRKRLSHFKYHLVQSPKQKGKKIWIAFGIHYKGVFLLPYCGLLKNKDWFLFILCIPYARCLLNSIILCCYCQEWREHIIYLNYSKSQTAC